MSSFYTFTKANKKEKDSSGKRVKTA